MTAPGPFLRPVRPSANTALASSPRRTHLTPRGEYVVATAVVVGGFLLLWLASALAYAATGVSG